MVLGFGVLRALLVLDVFLSVWVWCFGFLCCLGVFGFFLFVCFDGFGTLLFASLLLVYLVWLWVWMFGLGWCVTCRYCLGVLAVCGVSLTL